MAELCLPLLPSTGRQSHWWPFILLHEQTIRWMRRAFLQEDGKPYLAGITVTNFFLLSVEIFCLKLLWEHEEVDQTHRVISLATTEERPLQSTAGAGALHYNSHFPSLNYDQNGKNWEYHSHFLDLFIIILDIWFWPAPSLPLAQLAV